MINLELSACLMLLTEMKKSLITNEDKSWKISDWKEVISIGRGISDKMDHPPKEFVEILNWHEIEIIRRGSTV